MNIHFLNLGQSERSPCFITRNSIIIKQGGVPDFKIPLYTFLSMRKNLGDFSFENQDSLFLNRLKFFEPSTTKGSIKFSLPPENPILCSITFYNLGKNDYENLASMFLKRECRVLTNSYHGF